MLIWTDIETTGLDPNKDRILEVAWFITDNKLERRSPTRSRLVGMPLLTVLGLYETLDPVVLDMHTKSGLLDDLRVSLQALPSIESAIIEDIDHLILADRWDGTPFQLAGSSVHFDRSFLLPAMPELAQHLSHRIYDVSTLKLFAQGLGWIEQAHETAHRAADDIRASYHTALDIKTYLGGINA